MELKQLIRLKKEGFSNRKTADLLHVSRNPGSAGFAIQRLLRPLKLN